jgi:Mn2+/Fe2+ NRAMP family transporter
MKRLLNVLFWSVISAAFIGPGTVTTASSAGATFGLQLAWALLFSTVACIVLQEAVARLVIGSGRSLGEAIRSTGGNRIGRVLAVLVGFAIVLGCAAYEAGNILGGVAGIELILPGGTAWWTLAIGIAAGALLWTGTASQIARTLGLVVAIMGLAFVVTAIRLGPDLGGVISGSFAFRLPEGGELLALGLVGTTVVPYNLFLGAALAPGQKVGEMRAGLIVAIALGGLISLAVMVVGAGLDGEMSFAALAAMLRDRLGAGGGVLFAVGLFAAGFTSAVTAPLAAAFTVRSLLPRNADAVPDLRSGPLRAVWIGVLGTGVVLGMSGLEPIPVIVLAQALNGFVLPLVAILVLIAVNDRSWLGDDSVNGVLANVLGLACVGVTVVVGLNGLGRVAGRLLDSEQPSPAVLVRLSGLIVLGIVALLLRVRRGSGSVTDMDR